jgi:hypothetical protein
MAPSESGFFIISSEHAYSGRYFRIQVISPAAIGKIILRYYSRKKDVLFPAGAFSRKVPEFMDIIVKNTRGST